MPALKVAVFASGRGSNLHALIAASKNGRLDAEIVLVFSDREDAGALAIAKKEGISAKHLSPKDFNSTEDFDNALIDALHRFEVKFIALAGYLRMISPKIIRAYTGRILNIHPALLPSFGGKGMYGHRVHQAVLDYGCKVSGVTVHLVEEGYDTGPPVLQRCVPVLNDDTAEALASRVLEVEHQIYPEALQLFAQRRVEIQGRKVIIEPSA
ncbi:phosphoribosylglycinamide formyltransferase [bacterium]|nr:phosphoribosylglycinamide formyltransferase [bacterium]